MGSNGHCRHRLRLAQVRWALGFRAWMEKFSIDQLVGPDPSCLDPRSLRRETYTSIVSRAFDDILPVDDIETTDGTYATDGSCNQSDIVPESTTAAVVGSGVAVVKLSKQQKTSAYDGELLAVLSLSSMPVNRRPLSRLSTLSLRRPPRVPLLVRPLPPSLLQRRPHLQRWPPPLHLHRAIYQPPPAYTSTRYGREEAV